MNAWRGLRSYDGVLMSMALIFASVGVLAIGSKADAAIFQPASSKAAGDTHAQSDGLALVMKTRDSMRNLSRTTHKRPTSGRNADTDKLATAPPTSSNADGSKSTVPSQPARLVVESVQLTPEQPACQQGQTEVQSAQATLQKPLTNSTTVTWYWESLIDNGTASPISSAPNELTISAGTTMVPINSSDPTQPLLIAPAGSNYTYSFRLHILADGTDTPSAWVPVPQASDCQ